MVQEALGDRYILHRELARGGAGRVFLAEDKEGTRIALKVLHPELVVSVTADRFLREIGVLSRLDHPLITKLIDYGERDWLVYYAMPYIEGPTLRMHVDQARRVRLDDTLRIAQDLLSSLGYAHERGIMHRDVKPENIVLSPGGAILLDFGIAKAIEAAGSERLTRSGFTVGTSSYMSPEQASALDSLDHRSDLYSLGCVLYESLAGHPPFHHKNEAVVLQMQLTASPPDVRESRPETPGGLAEGIRRAMAKDPRNAGRAPRRCGTRSSGRGGQPAGRPDGKADIGQGRAPEWDPPLNVRLTARPPDRLSYCRKSRSPCASTLPLNEGRLAGSGCSVHPASSSSCAVSRLTSSDSSPVLRGGGGQVEPGERLLEGVAPLGQVAGLHGVPIRHPGLPAVLGVPRDPAGKLVRPGRPGDLFQRQRNAAVDFPAPRGVVSSSWTTRPISGWATRNVPPDSISRRRPTSSSQSVATCSREIPCTWESRSVSAAGVASTTVASRSRSWLGSRATRSAMASRTVPGMGIVGRDRARFGSGHPGPGDRIHAPAIPGQTAS